MAAAKHGSRATPSSPPGDRPARRWLSIERGSGRARVRPDPGIHTRPLYVADGPLAPFSALRERWLCCRLFWPGRCDLEQLEDAALGVGEAVQLDAGARVGEAESL